MPQKTSIIVIDDFYSNPIDVRNFALAQDYFYSTTGQFPGFRTKSFLNETIKEAIEFIVYPFAGKVIDWIDKDENSSTGAFQYTTEEHHSWLHTDGGVDWAAVLYLTPDAPPSAGTGFYRHKKTGIDNFIYYTEKPTEEDLKHPYFRDYKDILTEGPLYEFSLLAIHRNWSGLEISNLFGTIKDKLSDNTLEALATVAINKTSFSYSTDILIQIKDNISEDQLAELASIVIKKADITSDINRLLGKIKDKITSKEKLYELASIAIEKMSNEYPMLKLIDKIKDNICPQQYNDLRNQIKLKHPKACCTIM